MKIGIIGLGYVGGAIKAAMQLNAPDVELVLIDKYRPEVLGTYADLEDTDGVFICVPTPQDQDGSCDVGPLHSVLQNLKAIKYKKVIISKCTALPDIYKQLQIEFPNLVHVPEFLTAANAIHDYVYGKFCIIGGRFSTAADAVTIIRLGQKNLGTKVRCCSIEEAALAKYSINSFLATKVIFMNELRELSRKFHINYDVVSQILEMESRIGSTHLKVPGPDGILGFGGACFPKDTSALLSYAKNAGVDLSVLSAAVEKNKKLRR